MAFSMASARVASVRLAQNGSGLRNNKQSTRAPVSMMRAAPQGLGRVALPTPLRPAQGLSSQVCTWMRR